MASKKVFDEQSVQSAISKKQAAAKTEVSAKKDTSGKYAVLSSTDAEKLQISIVKRGKVLENDVQRLIIASVYHANVHGNTSVAQKMYSALSVVKGFRMAAVIAICEHFGNLKFDDKGVDGKPATKNFLHIKQFKLTNENAKKSLEAIVAELLVPENFWTVFTKEKVASTINVLQKVTDLITNAQKKVDKGETVENAGLIKMLNLAVAEYQSMLANEADKFTAAKKAHAAMDDSAKQLESAPQEVSA